MNQKISFTLKTGFPELNYLFPILNGMIIQGNRPDVSLKQISSSKGNYYLRIKMRRFKNSCIKIKRDLESVSDEVFKQVALLCDDDILYFESDAEGKHVNIHVLSDFMSFPKISMQTIPKLSHDFLDPLKFYGTIKLSCKFSQLESLANIYNIMFSQGYFISLRLRGRTLEIFAISKPGDHRASLTIGFNVASFDETRISEFNQLSARGFNHALFKVYSFANSGPLLEFKAE